MLKECVIHGDERADFSGGSLKFGVGAIAKSYFGSESKHAVKGER